MNSNFDDKNYLRSIFNDIDLNRNESINAQELHEALRKGQPISQFDYNTVLVLLQKYDRQNNWIFIIIRLLKNVICILINSLRNRDGAITFDEFYQLFIDLNNQYNEFLDTDVDFSGTIDSKEMAAVLHKKGKRYE